MNRVYTFRTDIVNRLRPHVRHIVAATDLEAMTKWCRLDSVQELSHDEVLRVTITSRPAPDGAKTP